MKKLTVREEEPVGITIIKVVLAGLLVIVFVAWFFLGGILSINSSTRDD